MLLMYGNKNTDFFLFSNTNDKWSAAFFQSNDKPEELANAHNGFGHGNNEGKNIDDQKHCKTLSRVSMDSNESSRKKKLTELQFQFIRERILSM